MTVQSQPIAVAIETHVEGAVLPVRAQPGARRNEIRGSRDGSLKVCVTQVAEKGKANKAIAEVLCNLLQLRRSQVDLLSGETSPAKRFLVRGLTPVELAARIDRAASRQTK